MHAPEPVPSLYDPEGHGVHSPPFGPEYPALQRQATTDALRLLDDETVEGQTVQTLELAAASKDE